MRKILLFIMVAVAAVARANTITVTGGAGHPGDEVTVSVAMDGTDAVTALEVHLPLGEWLEYVDGSCSLAAERSDGHTVSAAMVADGSGNGTLRIYAYSLGLRPFKGTSGTVLTFRLKLGNAPGDFALQPSVMASDAAGATIATTSTTGTATILCPALRVVTERIDFGHVPIRSSYTRSLTLQNYGNEPLTISNIVPNDDELAVSPTALTIPAGSSVSTTVTYSPLKRTPFDATLAIESDAVNAKIYNRWQTAKVVADPYSVNELHVVGAQGASDTEVEIALRMNNMEPIVGAQVSFRLPEALKYVDGSAAMTSRSDGHTITASVSPLPTGEGQGERLTLFVYSPANKAMKGDDGDFVTFRLSLEGQSGWYWLEPENVILSNTAMENMTSATSGGTVHIQSPSICGNEWLDFGQQNMKKPLVASYNISNVGEVALEVEKVTFLADGFRVTTALPLSIESGGSASLEVEYAAATAGAFATTMNIYSNDPMARVKSVNACGTAFSPNELMITGRYEREKDDYRLGVSLGNDAELTAVQFDITCSNPSIVGTPTITPSDRIASHTANIYDMGNGTWKVLIFSMSNAVIGANDGGVVSILFPGAKSREDVTFTLGNVVLSTPDGHNLESPVLTASREVSFIFPKSIEMDNTELLLMVGGEKPLAATVKPENATDKVVVWTSSDESVATVSANGVVTAVGVGESVVTATCGAISASCSVRVIPNTYTITYMVDGEVYKTETYEYGIAVKPVAEPTMDGYTFLGWSDIPETMPANDVTITGTFSVNSYTLIYTVDGEVYKMETVAFGEAITPLAVPTKEGYTFSGWSEIPAAMPANDVTVTGTFAVNSYTLTYTVDGETYKTETVAYGTAITAIAAPTKEGYTFSGWSEIPATMPANDVTITGTFSVNSYTITYIIDGEVYKTETYDYGAKVIAAPEPEREGATFSGWGIIPETMPARNVEIVASFGINTYRITYLVDDEVYKTEMYEYGSTITSLIEPTKEGYTFSGWSEIPATMPAGDVTVTGSFSVNKYMVRYFDGETLLAEYEVEFGAGIPAFEYDKEEYIFERWDGEVFDTMPAHDISFCAVTTPKPNGIGAVLQACGTVDVYTLAGTLVKANASAGDLKRLPRGHVYIVKSGRATVTLRM